MKYGWRLRMGQADLADCSVLINIYKRVEAMQRQIRKLITVA
jgi:hypothetical protein